MASLRADRPQLSLNHFFVGFLCASTNIVEMGKMCETQPQRKNLNPKEDLISFNNKLKELKSRKIISSKIEMGWCENDDVVVQVFFICFGENGEETKEI